MVLKTLVHGAKDISTVRLERNGMVFHGAVRGPLVSFIIAIFA
ncbi:hypothetical protein ADU37_CDS18250 [Thermococcus sp. 2319x1]|nr:hypothetical protein ADU37_CDS18250 [Thermococcus sp. 2319x1]